jgi:hypothetical protein
LLVQRLRAAYVASGSSIGKLAQELGGVLTAQGITEIFGERANPTSEQTLAILEYLKEGRPKKEPDMNSSPVSKQDTKVKHPMNQPHVFEPKPDRPPRVEDPDQPRTLGAAKERISVLSAELARLKSGTSTLPTGTLPAPAAGIAKPATRTTTAPTMTVMEAEVERARQARMEGLSSKPLQEQSVRELQAALNNAKPEDQAGIYRELQQRKSDSRLSNPRARLRGA